MSKQRRRRLRTVATIVTVVILLLLIRLVQEIGVQHPVAEKGLRLRGRQTLVLADDRPGAE